MALGAALPGWPLPPSNCYPGYQEMATSQVWLSGGLSRTAALPVPLWPISSVQGWRLWEKVGRDSWNREYHQACHPWGRSFRSLLSGTVTLLSCPSQEMPTHPYSWTGRLGEGALWRPAAEVRSLDLQLAGCACMTLGELLPPFFLCFSVLTYQMGMTVILLLSCKN